MKHDIRPAPLLALLFLVVFSSTAVCQSVVTNSDDDRKVRISENLKYRFPQLREAAVTIEELSTSPTPGMDEGVLVIDGRSRMRFLTTRDDSRLYLLAAEPVDASLSVQEVALELEKEKAAERREARERHAALLKESAGMPSRGPARAPVTIVEFSDFECPFCARVSPTVAKVLEKYPDKVRLVYRHFPLSRHPWAESAAIAAVCTARQSTDAFWSLHDSFFGNQSSVSVDNVTAKSKEWIGAQGLDIARWSTCAEDPASDAYKAARQQVVDDMSSGQRYGVTGTPAFFINGAMLSGNQPLSAFDEAIEGALAQAQ